MAPRTVAARPLLLVELAGDRLTLTSHTFQEAGEPRFNRLVWERVK